MLDSQRDESAVTTKKADRTGPDLRDEYDFSRGVRGKYATRTKATEGEALMTEGERRLLLKLLRTRFGELDEGLVAGVEAGSRGDVERWAERLLDAETPEDVLA